MCNTLPDTFQKGVEIIAVGDQVRFFQAAPATVLQRVKASIAIHVLVPQYKAVVQVVLESGRPLVEKLTTQSNQ